MDDDQAQIEEMAGLLHGYVSCCHNLAMDCVAKQSKREAGKILRACEQFMANSLPISANMIVRKRGIMHTVYNNLAHHANI